MRKFTRQEILNDFRAKIARKEPIIIGSAGIGLVAKMEKMAGIDMIMTCLNDYYRMDGHNSAMGYLAYADANTMTLRFGKKILKMSHDVPTIAGVGSGDPYREVDEVIDEMIEMGFCGIINSPAAGAFGPRMEKELEGTSLGVNADAEMFKICREKNVFSVAYAYTVQQAAILAASGADAVVAHAGITVGGMSGAPENNSRNMADTYNFTQTVYNAVVKENPDAFVFCHGGPLNTPERVSECFMNTDVHGFLGASAIDRIPIENAIIQCVSGYKKLKLEAL